MKDTEGFYNTIKARVKQDIAEHGTVKIPLRRREADFIGNTPAGELKGSAELQYLNQQHILPRDPDLSKITSHRPGMIGKLIVKIKRKLVRMVWGVLDDYFRYEQDYRVNLVRHLNQNASYIDERDAQNFWELIKKLDVDLANSQERIEILADQNMSVTRGLEKNLSDRLQQNQQQVEQAIASLQQDNLENKQALKTLDSVARGLEGMVASLSKQAAKSDQNEQANSSVMDTNIDKDNSSAVADYSYLLLENRFRGGEDEIAKRLAFYPKFFQDVQKPVLEIGAGRGELQTILKEQGITSYGIDLDPAMVNHCQQKGLQVELSDACAHLETCADKSLGGIIAIQVVEHLKRDYLEDLINLAKQKLTPGSKIIFETINPQSLLALSSNYFRDPTHIWPQHPDTLRYQLEMLGLEVQSVEYLSPVEGVLQELPVDDYMPPRWQVTIDVLNKNIKQINDLLYSYMDFAIIAKVK